ncbi:MAG: hypothetical protein KGH66_02600 [Candidatus Micrarchaeota archaeon]|nr:hypothetical protein [Candidatus Micrarchaeota archaeon]
MEFVTKLSALMTAAFGLVAALAWNAAIQNIFTQFFGTSTAIVAQLAYAIIVTGIAVCAIYLLGRMSANLTEKAGK